MNPDRLALGYAPIRTQGEKEEEEEEEGEEAERVIGVVMLSQSLVLAVMKLLGMAPIF